MNKYKEGNVRLFIWDNTLILLMGLTLLLGGLILKIQSITYYIALLIGSYFYFEVLVSLIKIITDINKNRIITEKLYIQYLGEISFEMLFKKHYHVTCHKVKGKKYTDKIIYLKSSKELHIKSKTIMEISYYEKSKIIKEIK